MQMRDYRCRKCGFEQEILHREGPLDPRLCGCEKCGFMGIKAEDPAADELPFERIIKLTASVIPDDVPGGFMIENLDKVPRWFPSKSAFQAELAARGLTTERGNQWRGNPGEGSDKPVNGNSRWF